MQKLREITILCNHILSPRAHYSLFRISPFMKGQALTVASTLRRVLLSELSTTRITSIVIQQPTTIIHEFSILSGFKESLPEIIENLREVVFRVPNELNNAVKPILVNSEEESTFVGDKNIFSNKNSRFKNYARLSSNGKRVVTAADIEFLHENSINNLQVIDLKQHIASGLSPHASLHIDLELTQSKQYITCTQQSYPHEKNLKTIIPLNSDFSPVTRVNYFVKQNTSLTYEFILLEIWTDGSITPSEALGHSSVSLKQIFQPFL
jgi:DNA-directed RNA polymerase subunit alpha